MDNRARAGLCPPASKPMEFKKLLGYNFVKTGTHARI
jgi:hypothetical protein